jgi:hypothetical protein
MIMNKNVTHNPATRPTFVVETDFLGTSGAGNSIGQKIK